MRFERIANALYRQPLFITTAGFEILDAVFRRHLATDNFFSSKNIKNESGDTDIFGNPYPEFEILGSTGIIPIKGPLIQHASLFDKMCGAVSYDDIRQMLGEARDAYDADKCDRIVLDFDSPGGQHVGCLETAEIISQMQVDDIPIFAWTEGQMASAAYMLAAGCSAIGSTRTAFSGCIGCMVGFIDSSKAFDMQGLKAEIIVSGKLKGTGSEGTSLSDEQRAYLQGLVDTCAAQFFEHVSNYRTDVKSESMQGQCFLGDDAVSEGIVDFVYPSLEDFLADL